MDKFLDNSGKAEMAIGSPTLSMWVASWNTKYPSDKIYCNNSNANGDYVGTSNKPTTTFIGGSVIKEKAGYKVADAENMYYPHKVVV